MAYIYCLCDQGDTFHRRNFYSRRTLHPLYDCLDEAVVVLEASAHCIKTGAPQMRGDGVEMYPNVDIFQCRNCGREFAVAHSERWQPKPKEVT